MNVKGPRCCVPQCSQAASMSRDEPCGGEGLLEKGATEPQSLAVDAVTDALRDVPLHRDASLGQLLAGDEHGVDRNEIVHIAMHQQDRRCLGRDLGERQPRELQVGRRESDEQPGDNRPARPPDRWPTQ